jgi:O-antigen ligase
MLMSVVITTHGRVTQQEAKLILMLQFLVPMCALVLGQLYEEGKENRFVMEQAFLYVVGAMVPLQLLVTWLQGYFLLVPYLYVFSVYQHLEYVPVIFAAGYLIALYSLWELGRYRKALIALAPLMGIYVSASASMMAIGVLNGGALGFTIYRWRRGLEKGLRIALLLIIASSGSYFNLARSNMYDGRLAEKFGFVEFQGVGFDVREVERIVPSIGVRMEYWRYFGRKIFDGRRELLFGHGIRADRSQYPSAHNYYLDFVYNLGVVALLPLMALIGYTVWIVYRGRQAILASSSLLGLTVVVLLFLFVDNSVKVGLRQPYPGIISFFLWGILLSRLYRASVMGRKPEKVFV